MQARKIRSVSNKKERRFKEKASFFFKSLILLLLRETSFGPFNPENHAVYGCGWDDAVCGGLLPRSGGYVPA